MRTKDTLKNSVISLVSFGFISILLFAIRKLFVITFSTELLGYEGLFSNVLSLLSLADLGIQDIILYRLFPAYAKHDENEVGRIMNLYSILYKWVGIVILILGVCLIPFLKLIIKDNSYNWNYVYIIYIIQLLTNLSTYFLAYKRIIYSVSQRAYECVRVDTLVNFSFSLFKVVAILILKNYYLYLLCGLGTNLCQNILISLKSKRDFAFLNNKYKTSLDEIKALGIIRDVKNNIVQKVSLVIYGGTDYIVISYFLGVSQVGLVTNYTMVVACVNAIIEKLLTPFQMSIGNYIYTEENGNELFRMFDYISFIIASIVACCYFGLFQPFIKLWLGPQYVLGVLYLLFLVCNEYIHWNQQFLTYFRSSFGKYELDKWWIFSAAIINLILSIALAPIMGVAGVMLGSAIGHMGFWIGRTYVVYKEYVTESIGLYIIRQIIRVVLLTIELSICYVITVKIKLSFIGFILQAIVCVMVPLITGTVAYARSVEMKKVAQYSKKVLTFIKR